MTIRNDEPSLEQSLADARHVLECARANLRSFAKKRMDKAYFNRFERKLIAAEKGLLSAPPPPMGLAEKSLYAVLAAALAKIRADAARAELPHAQVVSGSTEDLLAATALTEQTLAEPANRAAAARVGITASRVQALAELRVALEKIGTKGADPARAAQAIALDTARIREIAAEVLKKSPKILAEFASAKPKAQKKSPEAPTSKAAHAIH